MTSTARSGPVTGLLEYVRDALEDLQVLLVILGILFFIIIVIIQR